MKLNINNTPEKICNSKFKTTYEYNKYFKTYIWAKALLMLRILNIYDPLNIQGEVGYADSYFNLYEKEACQLSKIPAEEINASIIWAIFGCRYGFEDFKEEHGKPRDKKWQKLAQELKKASFTCI